MKKAYVAPQLTVHGNVEALTQVLGPSNSKDTLSIGGEIIDDTTGSRDLKR